MNDPLRPEDAEAKAAEDEVHNESLLDTGPSRQAREDTGREIADPPARGRLRAICPREPGYIILLVSQSDATGTICLSEPWDEHRWKDTISRAIAKFVNGLIENLIVTCCHSEGVREAMDVSVIGYCTDENGEAIIEPALGGLLAGRERVSITELADNVAREEHRIAQIFDEDNGELLEIPYTHKVWVEPKASFGNPMCSAMLKAYELADSWTAEHLDSFPPIVINLFLTESTDTAPHEYAESLKSLGTVDGNLLLFNIAFDYGERTDEAIFPTPAEVPLLLAKGGWWAKELELLKISSTIPSDITNYAKYSGFRCIEGDIRYCAAAITSENGLQNVMSHINRTVLQPLFIPYRENPTGDKPWPEPPTRSELSR
jgi:hypothetical protein